MSEDLGSRIWPARKGDLVVAMTWAEMTPSHLRNAAAFIRRKHQEQISAAYSTYSMVQGEMAEYYTEQGIEQLHDSTDDLEAYATEMETYAAYKEGHINQLKQVFTK